MRGRLGRKWPVQWHGWLGPTFHVRTGKEASLEGKPIKECRESHDGVVWQHRRKGHGGELALSACAQKRERV